MAVCSWCSFRCCSSVPPAPCTRHFGRPVVPEENNTYSGWSNGSRSKRSGTPSPRAAKRDHRSAPRIPARLPAAERFAQERHHDDALDGRNRVHDLANAVERIDLLPRVSIAVRREQHARPDLAEPVEDTRDAEIGRARRPDRAARCRREHRDHRLRHVRKESGHAIARAHADRAQRPGDPRDLGHERVTAQLPPCPAFIAEDDGRAATAVAQQVLGEIQPRAGGTSSGRCTGSGGAMRSNPTTTESQGSRPARSSAITPAKRHTAAQNRSGCSHDQRCQSAYGASMAGASGEDFRTSWKNRSMRELSPGKPCPRAGAIPLASDIRPL